MAEFDHIKIQEKWQKFWDENKTYKTKDDLNQKKIFTLIEFPYPSGTGLHVGHVKGQTAVDIYARFKRMSGYNVLNAMGWDAFGLPAENFAIKNKKHPAVFTQENINTFRNQIKSFGPSFDWDKEIDTTDPSFYKWTQWIFLQLFKNGLAYEKKAPINWCPSCKTGLANEEVINGRCERCDSLVEQRLMKQWFLKITQYADRLISDLDDLNWPEYIKTSQKNWIGKSDGTQFSMNVVNGIENLGEISVYTTRIDTVFGMTYAVIAPDHPDIMKFISDENRQACIEYIENTKNKSTMERTELNKDKTGTPTGSFVVNPFNGEKVPLWIADYVLGNYGTGAVMAVPAHDERDFEFAKKYGLENICIISPIVIGDYGTTNEISNKILKGEIVYTDKGVLIDSGEFTGIDSEEAIPAMQKWLEEKGIGFKKSNYKLRDWLFSRQRYRGEPIPVIHLNIEDVKLLPKITDISEATDNETVYVLKRPALEGEYTEGAVCQHTGLVRVLIVNGKEFSKIYDGIDSKLICDESLPLELPEVENYEPTGNGESPLASIEEWVNVRLGKNLIGRRETNTMPQWAGSSWYFLRYVDPKNSQAIGSPEKLKHFMPVDIYFGGAEHTTVHLLYSRFWNKALYDLGFVPTSEPYQRRVQHGLIAGEDGRKMSKRWGNVINPDDVIQQYGADTMRTYIMFMGPYQDGAAWSTSAINGVYRFINRVWALQDKIIEKDDEETIRLLHKTIKKVGEDIESISYHTALSQMMIFVNNIYAKDGISKESLKIFLKIFAPFAPFVTEEMWSNLGETQSLHLQNWPSFDVELIIDNEINVAVQFNGKMRGTVLLGKDATQEDGLNTVKSDEKLSKYITGEIKKVIFVQGKIINIIL